MAKDASGDEDSPLFFFCLVSIAPPSVSLLHSLWHWICIRFVVVVVGFYGFKSRSFFPRPALDFVALGGGKLGRLSFRCPVFSPSSGRGSSFGEGEWCHVSLWCRQRPCLRHFGHMSFGVFCYLEGGSHVGFFRRLRDVSYHSGFCDDYLPGSLVSGFFHRPACQFSVMISLPTLACSVCSCVCFGGVWWDLFLLLAAGVKISLPTCFFWRLRLDSGHKSSQVCSSASIDLWRFIDYKGFSEEESGMLLASNMINMGEAVITKESRVAPTT
ncbi:hypothetical protein DY000_02002145 [Brassica cretica]|uniref:Uncharacterized protein n=1 Tax=Brassica cretica TaxID=69181 RepID=A0ABQ7BUB5_BRACR|nr:hypothetical protein DY000_02002145 [Brassica cretica]